MKHPTSAERAGEKRPEKLDNIMGFVAAYCSYCDRIYYKIPAWFCSECSRPLGALKLAQLEDIERGQAEDAIKKGSK